MMGGSLGGGGVTLAGQTPCQGYVIVNSPPNVSPGVSALTGTIAYDRSTGIHWEKKNGTNTSWIAMDGWRDLVAHLGSAKDTGSGIRMVWSKFTNSINAWIFDTTANINNGLHVAFHVDHDYKPGSLAYVHIHSSPAIAGATGNVYWRFEYTLARGHGQEVFPTTNTINLISAASPVALTHQITETAAGISLLEPDTLILGFVYREGGSLLDTCTSDAYALYCDFHYQTDRQTTSTKAPPWDT
jgi:hypothetical protein